jgi:site-specific recombinase XerD
MAIHTGLRRQELANFKIRDIDTVHQFLVVKQGKGQKDSAVPLTATMAKRLEVFVAGKGKDESLFKLTAATISGKIKRYADKAGVKLHAHSLRDVFGTRLLETGANIREVQELLGHASLAVTERYKQVTSRHLLPEIDRLDSGRLAPVNNDSVLLYTKGGLIDMKKPKDCIESRSDIRMRNFYGVIKRRTN